MRALLGRAVLWYLRQVAQYPKAGLFVSQVVKGLPLLLVAQAAMLRMPVVKLPYMVRRQI